MRFSSIGDIVLTTPIIRCLNKQLAAELHFLTKPQFKNLLVENPYITKIWALEDTVEKTVQLLREENFDLIIDLHKNFRSYLISWKIGRPVMRFDKINFQKWLMTVFKINILPKKHLVDRYFEGISKLKVINDGAGLDFFLDKPENQILSNYNLHDNYVVGVLGAHHATKQIPFLKWLEIIQALDKQIVLIGGTEELNLGTKLKEKFPDKIVNLAGRLSVQQSAEIINSSIFVITPDTGMMHIAAALGKPLHVVWGNTVADFGMYPYYGNLSVKQKFHEVKGLSCRPCSKLGYQNCPRKHFNCMNQQVFNNKTLQI